MLITITSYKDVVFRSRISSTPSIVHNHRFIVNEIMLKVYGISFLFSFMNTFFSNGYRHLLRFPVVKSQRKENIRYTNASADDGAAKISIALKRK